MGVPTSEVGYTPAMPRREGHEVHKGHVVALEKKKSCDHVYWQRDASYHLGTSTFNNLNSRLDATIIILLTISISSTYFGR
jgi:hypothetical protein